MSGWTKSSFCRADSPLCVEVKGLDSDGVIVRNSNFTPQMVFFDREEWSAFIDGVKAGDFDLRTDNTADAEEMLEQA